jgi:NADP-dependent 3-hydroxy acid dehydrogenase YdfG
MTTTGHAWVLITGASSGFSHSPRHCGNSTASMSWWVGNEFEAIRDAQLTSTA